MIKIGDHVFQKLFLSGILSNLYLAYFRLGLEGKILMDIINVSTGRCWSSEMYNPVPGLMPNVPSSRNYEVSYLYYFGI
jgi:hypothetical protein